MKLLLFALVILTFLVPQFVFSQENVPPKLQIRQAAKKSTDTSQTSPNSASGNQANLANNPSLKQTTSHSSLANSPSGSNNSQKAPVPRKVTQHVFNHREQVIVGGCVMAGIAVMLISLNNFNPR